MGMRIELSWGEEEEGNREEDIITGKMKYVKSWLRVVGVYVNGDMEGKLEGLREWMEG